MLANPAGTISEAARLVPSSMRYSRFNLYLVKQAASWNNEPLYIYDEWVAYRNGAQCLVYDAQHGGTRDGNTDFIFAPLEFCTYGLAVMKMASAHGPIADGLRDFTRWLLTDCFNLYLVGKRYAPWAQAERPGLRATPRVRGRSSRLHDPRWRGGPGSADERPALMQTGLRRPVLDLPQQLLAAQAESVRDGQDGRDSRVGRARFDADHGRAAHACFLCQLIGRQALSLSRLLDPGAESALERRRSWCPGPAFPEWRFCRLSFAHLTVAPPGWGNTPA
jgi:hypothetical protein